MELTVNVVEPGFVTLKLTDDTVNAELRPGDSLVLVLRPHQPVETQAKPPAQETYNNSGLWERASDYGGGAAAAEEAAGEALSSASEDWDTDERPDR